MSARGRRAGPRACRVAALLALGMAGAGTLGTTGTAAAQEPVPATPPSPEWRQVAPPGAEEGTFWFRQGASPAPPRARLGVFLRTECPGAGAACDAAPVVASVVPGGPAARAGIRPGESLLSLDDVALGGPDGQAALAGLREGDEVAVVVRGTDGARRTIRLTPEVRESSGFARFEPVDPAGSVERAEIRVFRFPSPDGMERLEVRLDSLRGSGTSFVVVGHDARGSLRVEVAGEELAAVLADAPGEAVPAPSRAGGSSGIEAAAAPRVPVGYLVESPQLARSLARAREVALRSARVRLDSLVRLRKELPGPVVLRAEPPAGAPPAAGRVGGEGGATWTLRSADPEVELLLATNARIAGAEFRPLTAELAEYFRGAEAGLLVLRVIPGTPAERLGLRGGDVVFEAADRAIGSVGELRAALEAGHGAPVDVRWVRKGAVVEGRIELP